VIARLWIASLALAQSQGALMAADNRNEAAAMAEGPTTPRKSANVAPHSSPTSTLQANDTANSARRSSLKRTDDEIYTYSPSRPNKPISRPSTTPEQSQGRQLAAPLDFGAKKFTELPKSRAVASFTLSEPNPGLGANGPFIAEATQKELSFVEQIEQYKEDLEEEYKTFEQNLSTAGQGKTHEMDWEDLETRYNEAVKPLVEEEEQLLQEFSVHFQARCDQY